MEARYPGVEHIYIALDNWPVHFQPDVLAALQNRKITLLFLPTYAPWLKPIEKVWRKLKQEILHLHRYSSRWKDLQERVEVWLIQYDRPAPDLLHYVGLSPSAFVKVHYRQLCAINRQLRMSGLFVNRLNHLRLSEIQKVCQ